MESERRIGMGLLVLRVAYAAVFFLHGAAKLFGNDISFVQEMLAMAGWNLPSGFLWIIAVFEIVAALALFTGFMASFASGLLALEMLAAVVMFHVHEGFFIVAVPNVPLAYGFEYHLALISGLVCLAVAGPGAWALGGRRRATGGSPPSSGGA